MKKYLILLSIFFLISTPIFAKGSSSSQVEQKASDSQSADSVDNQKSGNVSSKENIVTPTDEQVKNQNKIETNNQGEEKQLSVKNKENEQLIEPVSESLSKVSTKIQELVEIFWNKTDIGQEVKEMAQGQGKIQGEIKTYVDKLNSRGTLSKFFIGSDKKIIKSMNQKIEQNRVTIQQLEELKLQTNNSNDLQQLQETVELMTNQNNSLQNKISEENKSNGVFGWLINLFSK
jgi:hypothetical protein